jgi:murein L,D-transpeptidase YafK
MVASIIYFKDRLMMSVYKEKDGENLQWITSKGICIWGDDSFGKDIIISCQYWCPGNQEMF